jgi:hypothetical protein
MENAEDKVKVYEQGDVQDGSEPPPDSRYRQPAMMPLLLLVLFVAAIIALFSIFIKG